MPRPWRAEPRRNGRYAPSPRRCDAFCTPRALTAAVHWSGTFAGFARASRTLAGRGQAAALAVTGLGWGRYENLGTALRWDLPARQATARLATDACARSFQPARPLRHNINTIGLCTPPRLSLCATLLRACAAGVWVRARLAVRCATDRYASEFQPSSERASTSLTGPAAEARARTEIRRGAARRSVHHLSICRRRQR